MGRFEFWHLGSIEFADSLSPLYIKATVWDQFFIALTFMSDLVLVLRFALDIKAALL